MNFLPGVGHPTSAIVDYTHELRETCKSVEKLSYRTVMTRRDGRVNVTRTGKIMWSTSSAFVPL